MNMKKMAIQFGERIGDDVPANQIKVKGGWLFHKLPDYPNEAKSKEGGCSINYPTIQTR